MPFDSIPDDVRAFVLRYIDSIAELEALLLLWSEPSAPWSAAAIASRLYISETAAEEVLGKLSSNELVGETAGGYQYCPSDETTGLVNAVAETYRQQLIPMTHLVHS